MLLSKVLSIALRRIGLSDGATAFTDNARDYFNIGLRDLCEQRQWRWLFKNSTFTTTASTQTYPLGATVMRPLSFKNVTDNFKMEIVDSNYVDTLDPNGNDTGTPDSVFISGINATTGYWEADLFPIPSGDGGATFTAAVTDIITSASHNLSNADVVKLTTTGTLPAGLAVSTDYYVISATTDTFKLSATSGGSAVDITGTGTGTHSWYQVEVIGYRYFAFVADKTSADDATDLKGDLPAWAQTALVYFITSQYKGELGDLEGEGQDMGLYQRSVQSNIVVDTQAESGDQNHRASRPDGGNRNFFFSVPEGSVS